jgi:catechol 2,3-dioxygenase-like lactoylglutathione lyase family enzyme
MKYRLEVVQLPVSDVDRAKAFYTERRASTRITTSGRATRCESCS